MSPGSELALSRLPKAYEAAVRGIEEKLHRGVQVYVSIEGKALVDDGVGEARPGVAMAPRTINLWLSASKPLTAVAVAQLWERGLLELDAPVAKYLPPFAGDGRERITLRHLLTHTSGLSESGGDPWPSSDEERLRRLMALPIAPNRAPGEVAAYSPATTWYLLGAVVEAIDGRPIDRYLEEEVFRPLGMDDWSLGIPPERLQELDEGIGWMFARSRTGELLPHPFYNSERGLAAVNPGANGRGSARSFARFYEALLNGGRLGDRVLLQPETVELFTARHRTALYDHTLQHVVDWGLGFTVNSNRYGSESVPYGFGRHAGEAAFGHSGAQSSVAFADPSFGLVVAVLFNGQPGEGRHQRRMREFLSALYESLGLEGQG